MPDDYRDDAQTDGTVAVGGSARGEIESDGDRDWFSVTLLAGRIYRFDLEGSPTDGGTLIDPYLRGIYDADGNRLEATTDDDGGIGFNSRVTFTATDTATYYVSASAWEYQEGAYTLSVMDVTDGVPDDFTAGTEGAGTVTVGGSATGEIESNGDRDWFSVTLQKGRTYLFDLEGSPTDSGTLSDPYLRGIYDADGNLIDGTSDDDAGIGRNSRVAFTATENATYYVSAGAFRDREGAYTLSVRDVMDGVSDDFATGTGTTGTITVGGSAMGNIQFYGDSDWFEVTLEAGNFYRFDLEGSRTGAGTLSDPYLYGIYDADGNLIDGTTNDDAGAYENSRMTFVATENATYYVSAGAFRADTGTYTLSVMDVTDSFSDDFAAGTGTDGTVAVGGSTTGNLDFRHDRDWFAVTLDAGRTYQFDLEGSSTGLGTLNDPYLRGIYDANGNLIAGTTNDDDGAGWNSRVTFAATDDGTYYVSVGAPVDGQGTYTLSVMDVTDGIPGELTAGIDTTGTVAVGGSATGNIDFAGDRDWFAVTLEAGKNYRFNLEGSETDAGALSAPSLHGIYDTGGNLIADTTTEDDPYGRYGRVTFTATDDGIYYVSAGALWTQEGTYTLSADEVM